MLIQNINENTTASQKTDSLKEARDIIADVVDSSSQAGNDKESADIADDIVRTGTSIVKTVTSSAIFQANSTSAGDKKNIRLVRKQNNTNNFLQNLY